MQQKLRYNFVLISIAILTLCYSNGIAFYTHLCTTSNQKSLSISGNDPCKSEQERDCCTNHKPVVATADCCKINFIYLKIDDNYPQQQFHKLIPTEVSLAFDFTSFYVVPHITFQQNNGIIFKNPPPQRFKTFPRLNILHQSFLC